MRYLILLALLIVGVASAQVRDFQVNSNTGHLTGSVRGGDFVNVPYDQEQSWTPVLKEGSNTLSAETSGYYVRRGKWVSVTLWIQNITATANGGVLTVEGLPAEFTAKLRSVGFLTTQGIPLAANEIPLIRVEDGSNVIDLMHMSAASHAYFTDTDLSGTSDDFYGQITYRIE